MKQTFKKRGQKLAKRLSRFSEHAKADGAEHIKENLIARLPNARRVRLLILEWGLLVIAIISLAITQAFWYINSYSVQAFVAGGTYIEATVGKVSSLNPLFASTSSEKVLSKLMFSTISTIDYSGHVGLGLAASITPDDTGENWTITLKDNLKWSDGQPITLDDVVYTIELIQNPNVNTIYESNFSNVELERVDNSLIFKLPTAYADFSATLNVPILPAHILAETASSQILEHTFSTNPVTSGAFRYNATQSVGTDGERIVYLSANPNYYRGLPLLDSFAVRTYANTADIINALSTGAVTATAELSATDSESLPAETIYEKQTAISNGIFAFLNTSSPLLSNLSVRQAIRQGINLDQVRSVLDGEAPLNYPILSSEITLTEYPTIPAYDLETAKSALEATGSTGKTLQLATISTGYFPSLAEELQSQLSALGFDVQLSIYEPDQDFLINVIRPRNYDILLYEVELGADPDLLPYYHSSQASTSGLNLSNYHNAIVDDLILAARSTLNTSLRIAKYESFLRYWVNDVPAIGIYQANLTYYFNKNVRSFSEDDRLVYATDRFSGVNYWAAEKATKNRTP